VAIMARPTKPESDRLTERVAFRVTAATKATYEARLAKSKLSKSEFFRDCVMTDRTEIIIPETMTYDMRESLRLLKNIANNCNQIAHVLNSAMLSGILGPSMIEHMLNKVSALLDESRDIQERK